MSGREVSITSHRPVTISDLKETLFVCWSVGTFLKLVVALKLKCKVSVRKTALAFFKSISNSTKNC